MLIVSERALAVMAHALDASELPDEQVLRLATKEDGSFDLIIGGAHEGDRVIYRDEKPVLHIDTQTAASLEGATLDVAEGTTPVKFSLKLPEPEI